MKVAVCISGALRGNLATLNDINKFIVVPFNADVFLTTWDTYYKWPGICSGASIAYRLFGGKAEKLLPSELRNRFAFLKNFKNTCDFLSKEIKENINEDNIRNKLKEYLDFKNITVCSEREFEEKYSVYFEDYNKNPNQFKMFYMMYRSIMDLELYKIKNNINYDFVFRIRPDISFDSVYPLSVINDLCINDIAVEIFDYGPQDQIFVSSFEVQKIISHLWEEMIKIKRLSPFLDFPNARSHHLLLLWLLKNGVNLKNVNLKRKIFSATSNFYPDITVPLLKDLNDNPYLKGRAEKFIDFICSQENSYE